MVQAHFLHKVDVTSGKQDCPQGCTSRAVQAKRGAQKIVVSRPKGS